MRLTKTLSEHKKTLLWAAVAWTVLLTVLCLIKLDTLPAKSVMGHDKVGHGIFHFAFVLLWFLNFRFRCNWSLGRALRYSFVFSLLYGIAIELMQYTFTDTRKADVWDVVANSTGGALCVLLLWLTRRRKAGGTASR
ncbi:MAG TPA: VanZ family protein [Flavobacterium sp.]|nr:VanZ family protein [Flavobacterium sp.]